MKRFRLITTIVVLSLFFVGTFPASASPGTVNRTTHIDATAPFNQNTSANLTDILNTLPDGHHDNFGGVQSPFFCKAEGWAADPDDRSLDLNIKIFSDGLEVAQTVADTFRQDLADAGVCTDGTCSFSVNLWGLISPNTDHVITVQVQDAQTGEWSNLYDTPKTLNCINPGAQPIVWDGFGNGNNSAIDALEVFNDNLYADATNYADGATIWRSADSKTWTRVTSPGFDSAYGANNPIVFDMATFKDQIYAGTGNWASTASAGQVWRSANGTDWNVVALDGLGNPNNTGFTTFTSFNGMLYAATLNRIDGAELWRSSTGNNGSWKRVATRGFGGGSAYFIITSLTTFKGQLYASVEATLGTGAQVWRSANGTNWTLVSGNGFGDANNYQTGSSVVYRSQLYMTTRNNVTGAQLWRSNDGVNWVQVMGNGFGDINNVKIESLTTYAGALYAAANNPVTGVELWRSIDGVQWAQINTDGFSDSGTGVALWSNGTVVFDGNYLIGSNGPFGGVIWELQLVNVPRWQSIVSNGFGNGNNGINSLEVFNGNLYADAANYVDGATIWRSADSVTWTEVTSPGFDSAYGANNPVVFDMFTFKDMLYAGTGNWNSTASAGQIWRSVNGTDWGLVASNGLGNPNNGGFTNFASFKGMLYAAALNQSEGAELWRSSTGDNGSWQRVANQGFGAGSTNWIITSLNIFNEQLYASVEARLGTGAQVWRSSNGTDWTLVTKEGFGDINNWQTGGSVEYRGQLYVTTRNDNTGGQLWRSSDGVTWVQVIGNGFGDINNVKIESVTAYDSALYAATDNFVTGIEIWRSTDGVHWAQINQDGFGNGTVYGSLWSNGIVVFQGNYLTGSSGPNGGTIWELQR